jgi:vacuolar-type H+-ATPase subunit H
MTGYASLPVLTLVLALSGCCPHDGSIHREVSRAREDARREFGRAHEEVRAELRDASRELHRSAEESRRELRRAMTELHESLRDCCRADSR